MTGRPLSRRGLGALVVVAALLLFAGAACSGDGGGGTAATTTTTAPSDGSVPIVASDPSVPVVVPVGRRFAIMLPADPEHGWRWVVEPVDTTYLAPLGSEFREDPDLLASATTTTTLPLPPEPTDDLSGSTTSLEVSTTTTEAPSTTTTAPGPLVQIVSYAGRKDGATRITLRYERIGAADSESPETVVFTILVGNALPAVPESPFVPPA